MLCAPAFLVIPLFRLVAPKGSAMVSCEPEDERQVATDGGLSVLRLHMYGPGTVCNNTLDLSEMIHLLRDQEG